MGSDSSLSIGGAVRTLLSGSVFGAAAAVANYGLVYLFVTLDGAGRNVQTWVAAGWAFFNAHLVDTVVMATTDGGSERRTINYLLYSGSGTGSGPPATSTVPAVVYFLVPVAVVVAAGYLLSRRAGSSPSTLRAAGGGAAVVAGYAPVTVLGLLTLVLGSPAVLAGGYVGPDVTTGVLLAGLLYPLAFGAIGGTVAR